MSSFEFVFNKKDEYTAKPLSDRYRDHLPMLVAVSRGFYGNREEMTFSTGQILRLHELRQQQRALVHDDKNNTLSVPLDYKHLFFVGDDHSGEALDEVIPIPLYLKEVTFCPIIGVKGRDIDDGGKAMMDRLLCRQSLARVDFNRDHSDKEMVQLSKKPLKATDNIYANIETNIYINVREKVRSGGRGGGGGRRQPPPPPPPEMPLHDQPAMAGATARESEYENRDTLKKAIVNPRAEEKGPQLPPRPGKSVPKTSKNPQPARSDIYDDIYELCMGEGDTDSDDGVYEPVDDIRTQPMLTTKSTKKKKEMAHPTKSNSPAPGPAALTSELADTLQKMKTRTENGGKRPPSKEPQRTPVKKPDEDESTKNTLPFQVKLRPVRVENNPKPSTPPSEEKAAILALKSSKTAGGNSTPTTPTAGKPEKGAKPVLTPKPEPPAKHPKHTGVDPSTGKTSPGKIPAVPQVPTPEPKTPKTSATQIKSSGVPPTKITQSLQVSATKTSAKSDYVNQKEMAIVGPTTRQKTPPSPDKSQSSPPKTSSPQPALQKQGSTQRAKLKPLQKMSISDVQALLPRLNMSKYQTRFEELQVDGLLLSKLDDQALKEDFEMSRTDMIKLKNFISEGHLPCYEDWHVK
ncbi:proteoglycan 4-like isoform X2 [Littorina saxatilis]|uniref:proteoglycan 4-like isoform X2 n=1 Tax=Littorina saxatilis TaxID=31220 RepID=UPI0038B536AD